MNTYIRVASHHFKNQPNLDFGRFYLWTQDTKVEIDHEFDIQLAKVEIEKLEKLTGKKPVVIEDNVSIMTIWMGFID